MPASCPFIRFGLVALLLGAGLPSAPMLRAAPVAKPQSKKAIPHGVYDGWRSIQGAKLSRDGQWLVYTLHPQEGDGEVVVRNLPSGKEWRHPRGREAQISADARFVAFAIAAPKAEVDKAKKEKKKPEEMPKPGMGLMDIATGKVETLDRVKSFRLGEEGGTHLVALLEAPEKVEKKDKAEPADEDSDQARPAAKPDKDGKKKEPGTDLILWELATGQRSTVPEVTEFLLSRDGTRLLYAVTAKVPKAKEGPKAEPRPAANHEGVYLRKLAEAITLTLLKGEGRYRGLAFDEKAQQAAFLSDRDDTKGEAPVWKLYHWQSGREAATEASALGAKGLPEGWAPSEYGAPRFSKDGLRLFFGTAPRPRSEPKNAPEPLKVDLWHWQDPELQPVQKVRAEAERKRSFLAVLHLEEARLVQLGSEEFPDIETNDNGAVALAYAPNAYRKLASWDQGYADVHAVDLATGQRRLLVRKRPWSLRSADQPGRASQLSPGGKWIGYFDAEKAKWTLVSTGGGEPILLGKALQVRFEREDHDLPELPPAHGLAGWAAEDKGLLVYDRYDLWALSPQDSRCLTGGEGRRQKLAFRYLKLDPEEKAIALDKPLHLLSEQVDTKATGYHRLDPGRLPQPLIFAEALLGARAPLGRATGLFLKAKTADRIVFSQQRFDQFPDLWAAKLDFAKPQRVTDANPQMKEYRWGRQELIDYTDADGKLRKALLTKPEDFDPARKYPLMVYIYEGYTDTLHVHQAPGPGTSINFTRFASHGYLVLRPDVGFETGRPGLSSLKCVVPAVEQLAARGFVDRARIGIQGHSWGGYQVAWLVGNTNLFRAAEAGAPVANMTSAYGGIRWGSGMSRAFQYEKGQSRIGATLWERPLDYLENSPLFFADRVQTPLLMIHNDEDDAVPWTQGIEYFSALRRLGKPVWLFNYSGDKHNLTQRENQKHWTLHLCEYFDHLLLGAPRPAWMDVPVPYLERGKRDLKQAFGGR